MSFPGSLWFPLYEPEGLKVIALAHSEDRIDQSRFQSTKPMNGFGGERADQATGQGAQGQALHAGHASGEVLRGGREEGARRVVGYPGLLGGGSLPNICPGMYTRTWAC